MNHPISPAVHQHSEPVRLTSRHGSITSILIRGLGIAAGVATHVLFGITVYYLYWFLKEMKAARSHHAIWVDALLALQFAVPHSWLLRPATRQRLGVWISSSFYGLFFCAVTCLSLLLTIAMWRSTDIVLWETSGVAEIGIRTGFLLSWAALFYSLWLSGLGYQTGLTPWLAWVRRQPLSRRTFVEAGWYRWFRHPIYLSFLGLIWFTPRMTLDHAVLTGIWTVYIFVGSWFKDRRLEFYVGKTYHEYEARVPGYPFLRWGPLRLRQQP